MTTQTALRDGCLIHAIPETQVRQWWQIAGDRHADVSVCLCCGGPAPLGQVRCKKCPTSQDNQA